MEKEEYFMEKEEYFMEKGKTLKKCIPTITMHRVVQQLFNC